jgi:hypothetical protein
MDKGVMARRRSLQGFLEHKCIHKHLLKERYIVVKC